MAHNLTIFGLISLKVSQHKPSKLHIIAHVVDMQMVPFPHQKVKRSAVRLDEDQGARNRPSARHSGFMLCTDVLPNGCGSQPQQLRRALDAVPVCGQQEGPVLWSAACPLVQVVFWPSVGVGVPRKFPEDIMEAGVAHVDSAQAIGHESLIRRADARCVRILGAEDLMIRFRVSNANESTTQSVVANEVQCGQRGIARAGRFHRGEIVHASAGKKRLAHGLPCARVQSGALQFGRAQRFRKTGGIFFVIRRKELTRAPGNTTAARRHGCHCNLGRIPGRSERILVRCGQTNSHEESRTVPFPCAVQLCSDIRDEEVNLIRLWSRSGQGAREQHHGVLRLSCTGRPCR
mmetsp:Transcript_11896/g.32343  ORF Transcript_11896/g.32343 Transcript_11896/m.32343 type:complete len:347 (+) Transcript_11896:363-1403(+)